MLIVPRVHWFNWRREMMDVYSEEETTVVEHLPFTVRIANDPIDFEDAISVRRSAYGRHMPEFAANMSEPDALDTEPGTVLLIARSNLDGRALGTMRIQTNEYSKLCVEKSMEFPRWLANSSMAEASRLGVCAGKSGRLVKAALLKAFYLYCLRNNINWMIATGRRPLYRDYLALMMEDIYPDEPMIPLAHVGNIPHRVLYLSTIHVKSKAKANAKAAKHPMYHFIFNVSHPEIQIDFDTYHQIREPFGGGIRIAN